MINYIEKGTTLHAEIVGQGHSLRQADGVWISSDDVAVQAIIDGYDPLQGERALAKLELVKVFNLAYLDIENGYPEEEKRTFSKQESEARAHKADSGASTPMLSLIATGRGITLESLVDKVIAKTDAFTAQIAVLIGRRQAKADLIDIETDFNLVRNIRFND